MGRGGFCAQRSARRNSVAVCRVVLADLCRDPSRSEPMDVEEEEEEEEEDEVSAVMDSLPPARPSGSSANSLSPSDMP